MSVIDMFISATLANSHLATRKHVARLHMRPRRAREAIMRTRIPSIAWLPDSCVFQAVPFP